MDHGTICFPAGGRGCPGLAHLPSPLGQKWNSLCVEEAVEASQLIPNSHMLPRFSPSRFTACFLPSSPCLRYTSLSLSCCTQNCCPQPLELAVVRGQKGGGFPSVASGLWSNICCASPRASPPPASCRTSRAPPSPSVLHFPEEVVSVVGRGGTSKADPHLDCGVMELVVHPLPAPTGPRAPLPGRPHRVISCLCFALRFVCLKINKKARSADGGEHCGCGRWKV